MDGDWGTSQAAQVPGGFQRGKNSEANAAHPPVFLTPLIGRSDEASQALSHLDNEQILTICGPGGVGKTRLASLIASELRDDLKHRLRWVSLASTSPESAPAAIRAAVGIHATSQLALAEAAQRVIRDQRFILVIDNAEHVVESIVPLLMELLHACPTLHFLVTSRSPLRIDGEQVVQLRPLGLKVVAPASQQSSTDAEGDFPERSEAAQLFLDRASRAGQPLNLDESTLGSVEDICGAVDGIPLAIELAAARVHMMSLRELAQSLEHSFSLLSSPLTHSEERHRSMQECIRWSFDLVEPLDQPTFLALSVFTGGCTWAAAQAICDVHLGEEGSFADSVSRLVNLNLLSVQITGESSRLTMLETVRQFARGELATSPELELLYLDRHAEWISALLARDAEPLYTYDYAEIAAALDLERPNIRAAFHHRLTNHEFASAASMLRNLQGLMNSASWVGEIDDMASHLATVVGTLSEADQKLISWCTAMLSFSKGDVATTLSLCDRLTHSGVNSSDNQHAHRATTFTFMMLGAAGVDVLDQLLAQDATSAEESHPYWGSFALVGSEAIAIHQGQLNRAREIIPRLNSRQTTNPSPTISMMRHVYGARLRHAEGEALHSMPGLIAAMNSPATALATRVMGAGFAAMIGAEIGRDLFDDAAQVLYPISFNEGNLMATAFLTWTTCGAALFENDLTNAVARLRETNELNSQIGAASMTSHEQYLLIAAGSLDVEDSQLQWDGSLLNESALGRSQAEHHARLGQPSRALVHAVAALQTEVEQGAWRHAAYTIDCCARILINEGDTSLGLDLFAAVDRFRATRSLSTAPALIALRPDLATARTPQRFGDLPAAARHLLEHLPRLLAQGATQNRTIAWDLLTPTEFAVTSLVATGDTNREVADKLFVSAETVKSHLSRVFAKTGMKNRRELMLQFAEDMPTSDSPRDS